VACQPAVDLRFFLPVTGDAEVHLELLVLQAIHRLHLAMASRTIKFGPLNMGDVVKKNKVRNPEYSDPGHGLLRINVGFFFLDFRMSRDYILVAEKTFLHCWQASIPGALHTWMTKPAVDLLCTGMNAMAEGDWLFQAYPFYRVDIV
jgi:hypothetical protein